MRFDDDSDGSAFTIVSDSRGSRFSRQRRSSVDNRPALSVRRDLWHTGWSFTLILVLLAVEWLVRRRFGLR